jgi:hypothetical protein
MRMVMHWSAFHRSLTDSVVDLWVCLSAAISALSSDSKIHGFLAGGSSLPFWRIRAQVEQATVRAAATRHRVGRSGLNRMPVPSKTGRQVVSVGAWES